MKTEYELRNSNAWDFIELNIRTIYLIKQKYFFCTFPKLI